MLPLPLPGDQSAASHPNQPAQGFGFEHIFGGGGFGGMRRRPQIRTAMRISFDEAVRGTTKTVDLSQLGIPGLGRKTVELNVPAGAWRWWRWWWPASAASCLQIVVGLPPGCAGCSLHTCVSLPFSLLSYQQHACLTTCSACPPCRPPAGVDTGFQLRLEGVTPGVQGMPPGDLIVQIEVLPSPVFRREDFDLYVDVPVDMADAALGTTIE